MLYVSSVLIGLLGHSLGCLPGFACIYHTNKSKDLEPVRLERFRSVPQYKWSVSFRFKTERTLFLLWKRSPNGTEPFQPNRLLTKRKLEQRTLEHPPFLKANTLCTKPPLKSHWISPISSPLPPPPPHQISPTPPDPQPSSPKPSPTPPSFLLSPSLREYIPQPPPSSPPSSQASYAVSS